MENCRPAGVNNGEILECWNYIDHNLAIVKINKTQLLDLYCSLDVYTKWTFYANIVLYIFCFLLFFIKLIDWCVKICNTRYKCHCVHNCTVSHRLPMMLPSTTNSSLPTIGNSRTVLPQPLTSKRRTTGIRPLPIIQHHHNQPPPRGRSPPLSYMSNGSSSHYSIIPERNNYYNMHR